MRIDHAPHPHMPNHLKAASGFTPTRPTTAPKGADAQPAPESQSLPVEGIHRAWGQTNSPYDVNHDKIVDIDDVQAFALNGWEAPAAPTAPTEPAGPDKTGISDPNGTTDPGRDVSRTTPVSLGAGHAGTVEPPLTFAGLQRAFGLTQSPYDFNGDNIVDIDDVQTFALHGPDGPPDMSGLASGPAEPAVTQPERPDGGQRLDRITAAVTRRLNAAGFAHRLPGNLHDLLQSLSLDRSEQKHVARALAERFPAGLGISLKA